MITMYFKKRVASFSIQMKKTVSSGFIRMKMER